MVYAMGFLMQILTKIKPILTCRKNNGKMKYSIHKRGEIAMKNILKIMLMMITIYTITGSAVYAAEIPVSDQDQLITSRDWTEISNLQDEMKKKSRMQPSIMTRH